MSGIPSHNAITMSYIVDPMLNHRVENQGIGARIYTEFGFIGAALLQTIETVLRIAAATIMLVPCAFTKCSRDFYNEHILTPTGINVIITGMVWEVACSNLFTDSPKSITNMRD